jgi:glutamate N-acetyltransferase/amino-acid N-acetyltransferase
MPLDTLGMTSIHDGPTAAQGFRAAGAAGGIRYEGRPDVGILLCDGPASAGAVFTQNRFAAAPVISTARRCGSRAELRERSL